MPGVWSLSVEEKCGDGGGSGAGAGPGARVGAGAGAGLPCAQEHR